MKKFFNKNNEIVEKRSFKLSDLLWQVLFALLITIVMFILSPGDNLSLNKVLENPILIFLNMASVLLMGLLLQGIFGRLNRALFLNSVIYTIVFVVHRTKVIYRDAPFVLSDFKLAFEAADMVKQSFFPDLFSIIVLVVFLLIAFFFTRSINKEKIKIKPRLTVLFSAIFLFAAMYSTVYSSDKLYFELPLEGNPYNLLDHFNSKGFNYTFLHNIKDSSVRAPEGYNKNEIKKIDKANRSEELSVLQYNKKPNIIWIMGEAFTDISQNPAFTFDNEHDPNKNFKRMQAESVLSGRIVTPSFGGGTGDTEFDVLTGTLTTDVSANGSISFNSIKRDIGSLPRFLDSIGYETRAFHPGYEWFYRRNEVYPKIGFNEKYFLEDIENPDIKGEYVSESQFSDIFIDRFEKTLATSEKPIFDYAVDIQNHGPYYYDKYKESYPFKCKYELDDQTKASFGAYFLGTRDIDEMIGRVYDMMKEKEEPIIMVFYGDHLPTFGSNPNGYEKIEKHLSWDNLEKEIEYYSTPFIVMANDAGREYLNKENIELDQGSIISSNYLASTVLDMLDFTKADNFFSYNSKLRKKLPIISRHFIYNGNTSYFRDKVEGDSKDIYTHYRKYEYYRINDWWAFSSPFFISSLVDIKYKNEYILIMLKLNKDNI